VVDAAGFRQVVGRFATGVTVVSTAVAGMRYGMTVNSFTSVSLDPLLVLFCCEHDASIHAPLLHGGHWSVSVLRADQVELSRRFAKSFPADVDAWTGVDSVAGAVDGDPLVPFALATMQCRTVATYAGGDHTILLGEAVTCELGEPGDPLLYYASRYRTVAAPDVG
jgi:flavin reductase (DIM6/NTAB) family NADH-FMN oxidoreductase RutF